MDSRTMTFPQVEFTPSPGTLPGRVASLLIFNDITSKKPEIAEMLHPFFASAIIDSAPSASATSQIKTITTPASQAEWSR